VRDGPRSLRVSTAPVSGAVAWLGVTPAERGSSVDLPPPFVSVADVRRARAGATDGGLVLADVRWYLDGRSGREAFLSGHLPGAVFVDLEEVLAGEPGPGVGRHPLPDPTRLAEGLGALGIPEDARVVAYDDCGSLVAARLVYLLRVLGQPAQLLDGGLAAWDGPVETGPPATRPRCRRPARPWPPDGFVELSWVREWSEREAAGLPGVPGSAAEPDLDGGEPDASAGRPEAAPAVVLDVRAPERYRGEYEPIDPRAGHVPGARNLPATELSDPASGRLRSAAEIRAALGVIEPISPAREPEVVAYCGSGVNACFALLALEAAGLRRLRLWPGSWSQWSTCPDLPVATGPSSASGPVRGSLGRP